MTPIEELKLRQQNVLLQAQSLERDIIVLNYKSLMEQAQALQQEIVKAEEEVRRNEELKKNGMEPIGPDPLANLVPTGTE